MSSPVLGSLRSHFFKHLSRTSYASIRHNHNLASCCRFSFNRSSKETSRSQCNYSKLSTITVAFSTTCSASETPTTGSSTSSYLSVSIRCRKDVADMLSEALLCFGASSTSMDEQDISQHKDEISISSIFSICHDVHHSISQAADSIGLKETPNYEVTMGYQLDWIKQYQESFQPVEVSEGLWIVPEWQTPPDLQATNIILNPGLAFGTGDHPTTKLCLLLLHGLIKGGEVFLDYGTGSGILAIAAIKFGAASSFGFDIDSQAITAACHNAALNNIGPEIMQLHLVSGTNSSPITDEVASKCVEGHNPYSTEIIPGKEKCDVVIANILLNPLLDLADEIVAYAKPGAVVGVSGVISEQVPCVIERYSRLLEGITVSKMDDWACMSGRKKTNLLTGS